MTNNRIASWWFRWDEFNYPDKGIERKLRERAARFRDAGVNLAPVFGFHCRWDYVYCFDRVHELIRLSREACHEHGIRLFDHYSATLVHRPRSMDGEWKLYAEGRNRMTFHPSAEMAETLAWRGSRLNDWRMERITNGEPAFMEPYQADMFCMNNPEFRNASADYLKKLIAETNVDGVMFDDGVFYPGWDTCGCQHCRALFEEQCGVHLPNWRDTSFWGNYGNPDFREWVRFRYDSAADFLNVARKALGPGFPLTACSSSTIGKHLDSAGENVYYFSQAIDHIMLEMCGEISVNSTENGLARRIPDLLTHRAVASRRNMPCFGLGFAFYPDAAFLVWALNKLFGVGCWISAGKGRVNVTAAEMADMPNEEDIVGEGYRYERERPALFQGKPDSPIAILFSSDTKINYGDSAADYEDAFRNLTQACFEENVPANVIVALGDAEPHPLLALVDAACLGASERDALSDYLRQGGTVVASGPLGTHDESGEPLAEDFLRAFGLICEPIEPAREVDANLFFTPWEWLNQTRSIPDRVEVRTDRREESGFFHIPVGKGRLYWSPRRLNAPEAVPAFLEQLRRSQPAPYRIKSPSDFRWRAFRNGEEVVIHFLNCNFEAVPHAQYCYLNKPIAESLSYTAPTGELIIHGEFARAELHSPDLAEVRKANALDGVIRFALEGVSRFCSVRLHPNG